MRKNSIKFVLLGLLLTTSFPATIYADNQLVQTDKVTLNSLSGSYQRGGLVTIAGKTSLTEVTVKVLAPDGTILFFDVAPAASGAFSTSFTLPDTSVFGTYQVAVGKGNEVSSAAFNVIQNGGSGGNNGGGNSGGGSNGGQPSASTGTNNGKGTTTTPSVNSAIEVKAADIPKPQNGVVTIKVAIPQSQSAGEVLLPANLGQLTGDSKVELIWDTASIVIPKEVVQSLSNLIPADKQNGSYIVLQVGSLKSEQVKPITDSNGTKGASYQLAGAAQELSLVVKDSSGKTTKLDQLSQPVTVSFQLNSQANQALAGIYYITDQGKLEYVGGKISGNTITAEVPHLGQYGVFAYEKNYSDIPASHWASKVIQELTAKHVIQGVTETSFAPEKDVTRAEFAAMLVRQLKLKATTPVQLEDVKPGSWYADAIAAAYSSGLVKGISDTKFGPDQKITREEMGVMIVKALSLATGKTGGSAELSFADNKEISGWAKDAVSTALSEGLMKGRSAGNFAPKQRATRAEASQVIYNLINKQQ
ncbi:S-layer homology domain-containing protein [Paenibacillus sp. J22TS3]|uniref:S-layer homology domain-containing protein n=1 Tax=Paenibacillus sp. J22TS3 TaxID=2807192 RepID=UPI001B00EFD9|nr:S-layer homology domain-containing protein [Paenibacillus sp. J22TS3]GIP24727.1 hypothetical protein J22TS3_50020 [Paenibacillus sp. J22TS3]